MLRDDKGPFTRSRCSKISRSRVLQLWMSCGKLRRRRLPRLNGTKQGGSRQATMWPIFGVARTTVCIIMSSCRRRPADDWVEGRLAGL